MPGSQTTTNGPQMLPPQRSSGSGGDEEPISDIDEDEIEDENIDVDEVDDDITPNGGLTKADVLVGFKYFEFELSMLVLYFQ